MCEFTCVGQSCSCYRRVNSLRPPYTGVVLGDSCSVGVNTVQVKRRFGRAILTSALGFREDRYSRKVSEYGCEPYLGKVALRRVRRVIGGQTVASAFVVSDGRVASVARYDDLAEALDAVGINNSDETRSEHR